MAETFSATLRLLHIIYPYQEVVGVDRISGDMSILMEEAEANAHEQMEELKQMDFLQGLACETEVCTGYPVDQICAESSRPDIDLVVTSTHGRTGFKHALLGSAAEHVVRYAECPVLIVPSRI